jgi:hypothetical protein
VSGELGPFQEFTGGDEAIELVVGYEVVLDAVRLAGTRLASGDGDGLPDLGMNRTEMSNNRALSDPGRSR